MGLINLVLFCVVTFFYPFLRIVSSGNLFVRGCFSNPRCELFFRNPL